MLCIAYVCSNVAASVCLKPARKSGAMVGAVNTVKTVNTVNTVNTVKTVNTVNTVNTVKTVNIADFNAI